MFVPSIKNGHIDGFKLFSVRPTSVLAQMGLRVGDVIHAVDNVTLATLMDVLELYLLVHQREFITITYSRDDGPRTTFTYGLQRAS